MHPGTAAPDESPGSSFSMARGPFFASEYFCASANARKARFGTGCRSWLMETVPEIGLASLPSGNRSSSGELLALISRYSSNTGGSFGAGTTRTAYMPAVTWEN